MDTPYGTHIYPVVMDYGCKMSGCLMFPAIHPFNTLTKNVGGWLMVGLMVGKTLQNANSIEQTNIQRESNDAYVDR